MSDRTSVISLDPPIQHDGGAIGELRLREPTGGEMRDAEKELDGGFTAEAASAFEVSLVGAVTGVAAAALDKLPVTIMRQARTFLTAFDVESGLGRTDAPSLDVPLPLPESLTVTGISYSEISLAEPTVGMRRKAESALRTGATSANARQYQLILVAQASGIPFAAVEKFPVSALNDAEAFLRGFIEPGRRTGSA